eukprot:447592_1
MESLDLEHSQYILGLQQPLYSLVKTETDVRLRYLVLVANHPVASLHTMLDPDRTSAVPFYEYKINTDIYNNFLRIVYARIQNKCEKGINFDRFKKQVNEKTIWNALKGYWFHEAPTVITHHLWGPLLQDITQFYYHLACHWSQHQSRFSGLTVQKYLLKRFLSCLLEVKCKLNKYSNSGGTIIQAACWKQERLQRLINSDFDFNNGYNFELWMNLSKGSSVNPLQEQKNEPKKSMSIQEIVSKYIKVYAQYEYQRFIGSLGIYEIYSEYSASAVDVHSVCLFYNNSKSQ